MARASALRKMVVGAIVGTGLASVPVSLPAAVTGEFVEVDRVRFTSAYTGRDERLDLRGAALLRWRRLFRAYVAALYLPPLTPPEDVLEEVSKRLEIEYFWSIRAEDFGRAADQLLGQNLDAETLAPLRSRLDEMHAAYESIEAGDRYALDYRPGSGTELSKNGRPLVVIPGADFAAAYFSIWLGESPIDPSLRDSLLGTLPMRAQE